jgi:hypothetical protein
MLLGMLMWCWHATARAQLPADVAINKEAGRGGHLIVHLRVEGGEELRFMVDTGAPVTILDKTLESRLGERLFTMRIWSSLGQQQSGLHAAPKMYLGSVPLKTDSYVTTYDFNRGWTRRFGIMGILGMDCLRHYCIQLDFEAGKMRFVDPGQLSSAELGKPYPITFSSKGQRFPPMFSNAGQNRSLPILLHTGLLGGSNTNALIDTGDNVDGSVETGAIQGHYLSRLVHFFLPSRAVRVRGCVWDGQTYTSLKVGTAGKKEPVFGAENIIGLRFFARHLVTFDFPSKTMYLKQTSVGPLGSAPPARKASTIGAKSVLPIPIHNLTTTTKIE